MSDVEDGEREPTEWNARLAGVLTAGAVAAGVGVAGLGWSRGLVAVPVVATIAMLGLLILSLRRIRRAEAANGLAIVRLDTLESKLRDEAEGRADAEARLVWRSRLRSLRRSSDAHLLTDPETGLLHEGWLTVAVDARIASGRRRLTPVAVIMLEVVDGLSDGDPQPADPMLVAETMLASLRESDGAFRLHEGGFAVLLEDSDDMGALIVTSRIGDTLAETRPEAVVRAGVACYPAHGLTSAEVLDRAEQALEQARGWRQHRVEVAPSES